MRGPNLLRLFGRYAGRYVKSSPSGPTTRGGSPLGWLRMLALAGLVGIVAGGVVASCAVVDTEYCLTNDQCPTMDTDMGPTHLTCHPTRHVCMAKGGIGTCVSDSECDYLTPRCEEGVCTSCKVDDTTDQSCAQRKDGRTLCANAAGGSGTLCVACQINANCPVDKPICDNQACRKCSSHQDCEGDLKCDNGAPCTDSLVCIQDGDLTADLVGRCAQNGSGTTTGRVIYVNSAVTDDQSKLNNGTEFTKAVNTLHQAMDLAQSQSRRYIRLVGTLTDAPGIQTGYVIKDVAYSFIGTPVKKLTNSTTAVVQGRNTLFQVTGTGSLTLDQVNLLQKNKANDTNSVTCAGAAPILPTLNIRRSVITGSTPPNLAMAYTAVVAIYNCNTVLDSNIIGLANTDDLTTAAEIVNGTGILINDTSSGMPTYLIQNNIIAGNAGSALDMSGAGHGTGKFIFRFNTFANNGRGQMGAASGIFCPSTAIMPEFSHSIVVGNSLNGGSQFNQGNNCNLKDVVVGTAEMGTNLGNAGIIKLDPKLNRTFRMQAASENSACCIDKVTPAAGESFPSYDVDGNPRPQPTGGKWDIGASELKQ